MQMCLLGNVKFVCLCWGFTAESKQWVMSSAVSLPNHTFTGQASSSKRLTSIVHILSPETDNCPSSISGRERMTVENISWSISTKECCRPRRGLNPRPPGLQSDGASNWATEAGNVKFGHLYIMTAVKGVECTLYGRQLYHIVVTFLLYKGLLFKERICYQGVHSKRKKIRVDPFPKGFPVQDAKHLTKIVSLNNKKCRNYITCIITKTCLYNFDPLKPHLNPLWPP